MDAALTGTHLIWFGLWKLQNPGAPWAELVMTMSKRFLYEGTKYAKKIEVEETMAEEGAKEENILVASA